MAERIRSAKTTTKKAAKKAAARPGPRADKADGESAVLAKIAAMPKTLRPGGSTVAPARSASVEKSRGPVGRRLTNNGKSAVRQPATTLIRPH